MGSSCERTVLPLLLKLANDRLSPLVLLERPKRPPPVSPLRERERCSLLRSSDGLSGALEAVSVDLPRVRALSSGALGATPPAEDCERRSCGAPEPPCSPVGLPGIDASGDLDLVNLRERFLNSGAFCRRAGAEPAAIRSAVSRDLAHWPSGPW